MRGVPRVCTNRPLLLLLSYSNPCTGRVPPQNEGEVRVGYEKKAAALATYDPKSGYFDNDIAAIRESRQVCRGVVAAFACPQAELCHFL